MDILRVHLHRRRGFTGEMVAMSSMVPSTVLC